MKTYFNGEGSEDSTWKIVYMDMITMLMILFLSLWIIDRGKPSEKQKHGDVTLTKVAFDADDYFDPGKSEIREKAREKMEKFFSSRDAVFPRMGVDLELNGRRVVLIHGHTDDQGGKRENFQLGFLRAMAVYDELSKKIPDFSNHVGICSFADNFPLERVKAASSGAPVETSARLHRENFLARKKNRRFEIVGQFEEIDDISAGL